MTTYEPGKYQKGDRVKTARSRKEAVALTFEGYKPVPEEKATEPKNAPAPTVSKTAARRDTDSDKE